MNDLLVSIIVPVYNAEKYISKCLDSIFKQTHENIEIIVINDGSTDGTLGLLESFNDKRLIIINQANSGVSSARNAGLNISNGDYVVFVDGDDYLSNDFVEIFLKIALEYKSDFVFSTKCITTNQLERESTLTRNVSNEEATALLLDPDVIVGCWNKIYKKDFLKDHAIVFSTELFYGEGLRFITTVSQMAENVVVTNAQKYFYRRNNELSATTIFKIGKYINGEKSLLLIRDTMVLGNDKINDMWLLHLCLFYLGAVCAICSFDKKRKNINFYKKWIRFVRKKTPHLLFSRYISFYRKSILLTGCLFPKLLAKMNIRRKKKISKRSID